MIDRCISHRPRPSVLYRDEWIYSTNWYQYQCI